MLLVMGLMTYYSMTATCARTIYAPQHFARAADAIDSHASFIMPYIVEYIEYTLVNTVGRAFTELFDGYIILQQCAIYYISSIDYYYYERYCR